jgi:hypothetical protein
MIKTSAQFLGTSLPNFAPNLKLFNTFSRLSEGFLICGSSILEIKIFKTPSPCANPHVN